MTKSRALSASPSSLLEAKQESVRIAISDVALELFAERGFDATTVDEIARKAGIGRRTFFRYFETKDDVVLWRFDQFARGAMVLLKQRPAREPALTALERALTEASEFYNRNPTLTVKVLALTEQTRSLFAQQLVQGDRWKAWFAEELRARGKYPENSVQPEITSAVGFEAMGLAVRRWVAAPALGLSPQIARCFAALRKVTGARA